ncbi:MAG: hypothetical protein JWO30_1736 [Fibrobacteres bacterium]|nr:hypothetical protein [Fibrobacterota bacterium]
MNTSRKINGRGTQAGFGLLETMMGLVVFMLIAFIGTKAFKGVIANQKEASQVKALTDAVTVTAEKLSALSVATLTESGSKYLGWSEPAEIGSGEYRFRYRTFPNPTIQGVKDTAVVGLEVETGSMEAGVFTANRSFATLIAPHLSSKDKLGQISSAEERAAEAAHYASMRQEIADVSAAAKTANQTRLNSFTCYDQGQCCDFMKAYFANPSIQPKDGLDQKCNYRCAQGGSVPMKAWQSSCHTDFCAIAPWKNSEQCCAAIAAGECNPGSACAQVCIDCVGQDGSTCGPPICDGQWWNDFFDCKNGQLCDGSPMPTGIIPGWGNVKSLCGTSVCAAVNSECGLKTPTCCHEYWGPLNRGETPDPKADICATISSASDCCSLPLEIKDWDPIYCGTDGQVVSAHNKIDGKWYCGFKGGDWDKVCSYTKGCATTYKPSGASGPTCAGWDGVTLNGPWADTYPKPAPPVTTVNTGNSNPPAKQNPGISIGKDAPPRVPSNRNGGQYGSSGGRE